MHPYDFLVIGSGVAGLSYALQVSRHLPHASIAVVTKADENESNTKYAQGGIAIVVDTILDSFEQHIQDTLVAGDGICNPEVVRNVITQGPHSLLELLQWGVQFDKKSNGNYDLGLEGGHSQNRILHHKDITGKEIEQSLLKQIHAASNIHILSQYLAIDLITQEQHNLSNGTTEESTCYGAYVWNIATKRVETFSAKITMLATGGIGQVYQNTTNPSIATGDGIGMAHRANAKIENMEFVQFHPTALYNPSQNTSFLISEAVRGAGALLRNKSGEAFMYKYHPSKELAPRDIVCRAIVSELKRTGEAYIFLDCRHLNMDDFKLHFPFIFSKMLENGIQLEQDMIPVVPTAHYLCGGITVNKHGQTSIKNLFAGGECSHTGLHGANRLASNSLLEALVYAHNSYLKSIEWIGEINPTKDIPNWKQVTVTPAKELLLITQLRKELKSIMSKYLGIIRSNDALQEASIKIKKLQKAVDDLFAKNTLSIQLIELRNMVSVAQLIVHQSQAREENKGGFYNLDFL